MGGGDEPSAARGTESHWFFRDNLETVAPAENIRGAPCSRGKREQKRGCDGTDGKAGDYPGSRDLFCGRRNLPWRERGERRRRRGSGILLPAFNPGIGLVGTKSGWRQKHSASDQHERERDSFKHHSEPAWLTATTARKLLAEFPTGERCMRRRPRRSFHHVDFSRPHRRRRPAGWR